MTFAIDVAGLTFAYENGPKVLDIPTLQVTRGERVFLHGPSGCGKTTLLGILGGVLKATTGAVKVLGTDLNALSSKERDSFRGAHVGYIFQMFNLIPYLTVKENVTMPCLISERRYQNIGERDLDDEAAMLIDRIGLANKINVPVTELSVGQQQRVAAVRSLIGSPEIVIADEPTSSLDAGLREKFIKLLFELSDATNSTLIFVSHDQSLKSLFSRTIALRDINKAASEEEN